MKIPRSGSGTLVAFYLNVSAIIVLTALAHAIPSGASHWVIWPVLAIFYAYYLRALVTPVEIMPGIPSYISIEVLFLTFYYLLFYAQYQLYVLGLDDLYHNAFLVKTYFDNSNKALVVSTIGLVSFCFGRRLRSTRASSIVGQNADCRSERSRYGNFNQLMLILMAGFMIMYEALGLQAADEGRYTRTATGGALADGVYLLIVMLCIISIAAVAVAITQKRQIGASLLLCLALTGYWAFRMLLNGDRNSFFLLAIAGGGAVAAYWFRVSRLLMFGGLVCAIIVYNGVEAFRMQQVRSVEGLIEAIFTKGVNKAPGSSSFTISTTAVRAMFDVAPETEGYGYGKYKLIGVAGIVPFVRGVFLADTRDFTNSAEVLTYYVLGKQSNWSIGSNILQDIYLDFGLIGIPLLMVALGWSARRFELAAAANPTSAKSITIYVMALALYAELPRYSLDFPIRMLVWTLFLFWAYDVSLGKLRKATFVRRGPYGRNWPA